MVDLPRILSQFESRHTYSKQRPTTNPSKLDATESHLQVFRYSWPVLYRRSWWWTSWYRVCPGRIWVRRPRDYWTSLSLLQPTGIKFKPVLSRTPVPCYPVSVAAVSGLANFDHGFNFGKCGLDQLESTRSYRLYTILCLSLHLLCYSSANQLFPLPSVHL